jgi:FKBP-type peptidyl-prolyl cis-trans isomerase FklB
VRDSEQPASILGKALSCGMTTKKGPGMKEMKYLLIAAMCSNLALSAVMASDKPELTLQKDRESYSIGFQVGTSIKNDGVEIDLDLLMQGLKDAIEGTQPRLSQEEMTRLITDLRKVTREAQQKKIQELGVKNLKEGEAFLAENQKKEGVKTTGSGLQYRILKEGDGPLPKATDTVSVHYKGSFIDGKEFHSSYERGTPEKFQVSGVIKGWTEALQLMKVGSKWQIFVPPELAYGQSSPGARIPPNSALVFEIDLLSIEQEQPPAGAVKPQPSGTKP